MVLVPWGRDQTANAERAEQMGVAEVVPRDPCTSGTLALAIGRVLSGTRYAGVAKRVSERLQSDDPIGRACHFAEQLLA